MATIPLPLLDNVRIASPCHVRWEDMQGDERVRHCSECDLNVFNLSEMTRTEAEALLVAREGRLCAGFWRRADGTILTKDCPVGFAAVRAALGRRAARMVAAVGLGVSAVVFLSSKVFGTSRAELRYTQPIEQLCEWLSPRARWASGALCAPLLRTATTPGPVASTPAPGDQ